ncbi:MAG: zf-HC2 domain-containing protein [Silvibacterium sp.]
MTDHLSLSILNGLADGELSADQLARASEHLTECPACTSNALFQSLLKTATAKAGERYTPPPHFQQRLASLISQANPQAAKAEFRTARASAPRAAWRFGSLGWAAAAAILILSLSGLLVQRANQRARIVSAERAALVTEVFDQHVATLAASLPPQVLSSDRHTVKPWFQGKIPFSFNLPQNLPGDTTLDGANLNYLYNRPVAQLLYSIGRHRVSVFVREKTGATIANEFQAEHSGFHVMGFNTDDLEIIAVSDVDKARLADLVSAIRRAQTEYQKPAP